MKGKADAKETQREGAMRACVCGQVPALSIFWPSPAFFFCSCPFRRLRCAGVAAVAQPMTGKKWAIRGVDLLQGKSGDRGWDEERCEGAICLAGTMEGAVGGSYPQ